ncbi:MAG: 2Fe-2S iron-sulfur cluster-binding protein [bacterium]|nr:2Fe-2S iron-sulfur cluster-binding protein [bacterium]
MRKYRVPLPPMPTKKYNLRLEPSGKVYEVDPAKLPYTRHGLPGSVLDIVSAVDEHAIEHTCGGVQACSTCHVYIADGFDCCGEMSEREEDFLETARAVKLNSRLACCAVPDGSQDVVVEVPSWNKNEVKE